MKKTAKKNWSVMVYMAGDNNLDPEGIKDLLEMKKVGSTDQINIIAQFDRLGRHFSRRYYLRKGTQVASDAVASLGPDNTGDPKSLSNFIRWGVENYPADRYLLVLWNHGQGWDDTDVYADERFRRFRRLATGRNRHALFHSPVRRVLEKVREGDSVSRAILLDDHAKDFLDNHEMKKVLAGATRLLGRKIDILGMDACLMSMIEVGCQIRKGADYTVGSEQTEPGEGWPYHTILKTLAEKPGMTPRELSFLIVRRYLASYSDDENITLSACDLSKADALIESMADLTKALREYVNEEPVQAAILHSRHRAQSFDTLDYVDLVDLCSLLGPLCACYREIEASCRKVVWAVEDDYVMRHGFKGDEMGNSNGVSIYFPLDSLSPLYQGLDFSKKTGWGRFLTAFIEKIRKR